MKTCRRCGENKELLEVNAGRRYRDGLPPWCKACYRGYRAESGYTRNLAKVRRERHDSSYFQKVYSEPWSKRRPECKQTKSTENSHRSASSPDGFARYCKFCGTSRTGRGRIKKKYGIAPDEYDRLLSSQDGKCAICDGPPSTKKGPVPDHCHNTGRTRGILCQKCNTAIGKLHDDPYLLRKAADYLTK
jgi:hypothetical protein